MRNIKTYRVFESETQTLTPEQIKWLDQCTEGTWKLNPRTGLVDVKGDFDCSDNSLTSLQGVRFGVVSGDFSCYENSLTSLVGAPQEVGGDFWCYENSLTSLEGAPQKVGGGFHCFDNPVPEEVLMKCYKIMKSGKTYSEAVQMLWEGLDQDTKLLMYRPSFGWLSPEENKKWAALKRYQQIKTII
jgi:hypothetical protein